MLLDEGKMSEAMQLCEAVSRKYPECVEVWQLRLASPTATNKEKKSWLEEAVMTINKQVRRFVLYDNDTDKGSVLTVICME